MSFKNQFDNAPVDDLQKLMCSVHGCEKRWSVIMGGGKPMCSEHQWAESDLSFKPVSKPILIPITPVPEAWWNKNEN